MIKKAPLIAMLLLAGLLLPASAYGIEAAPKSHVEDRAGVIDAETMARLSALLLDLEQKTGARIVVLTVETTNGQDITQYAFERADKWKLGANKKSASVLAVVAVDDRKYSFQVGYDHEGVLPDALADKIARAYLVPHFKAKRYSQGIFESTAAMAEVIADDRSVTLTGMPDLKPMSGARGLAVILRLLVPLVFVVFVLVGSIFSKGRNRNMLFWGLLVGSMMGGRGGGGGGSFSGFGGGGGGGFGGGGASGGW